MNINTACIHVLEQLRESVSQMTNEEFTTPVVALNGSTIGQHCRHTIEFFTCLQSGYTTGLVDYDKRRRAIRIESDTDHSAKMIDAILSWLRLHNRDRQLKITVTYDDSGDSSEVLDTTFYRELVYNIEHAIHHMALIKVGIRETCPHVTVDQSYGVAVSTLRHRANEREIHTQ